AYGCPDAAPARIHSAAEAACADEFIRDLPEGYETRVGPRGATLSVGQRQRIAIARALLRDAAIVILDEPTAAVDPQTEAALMTAIARLLDNRMAFIIAHRLSTACTAGCLVVLRGGRIVQSGTHEQLIQQAGEYARLFAFQLRAANSGGPFS